MKEVLVPGSKSISNRVLVLAALSSKPTILRNLLDCDDTRYLREALSNFGVQFEQIGINDWKVTPPEKLKGNDADNFIGNGGTPARFLVALSTITEGSFTLRGVDRMHERPFADLFKAVEQLGVEIEYLGEEGYLPARFTNLQSTNYNLQNKTNVFVPFNKGDAPNVKVQEKEGQGVLGAAAKDGLKISGKVSSQFISGLLLVASKLEGGLEIQIIDQVPSRPYVEMTVEMLKIWGVQLAVSNDFKHFHVETSDSGVLLGPTEHHIPADCSSASYPMIYSLLSKKPICITNFGEQTLQGDEQFLKIVEKAGGTVQRDGGQVIIHPGEKITPLGKVDFSKMPDVSMSGMVLASFAHPADSGASIKSDFTGLESLRVKECDRIQAMIEGLQQLGITVEEGGNEVIINGCGNSPFIIKGDLNSYDDHRIAMVFGIIREVLEDDFDISHPSCVAKSWPDFWLELADWSGHLREVAGVIVSRKACTEKPLSPTSITKTLDSQSDSSPYQREPQKEYLIVRKPRKEHAWQFPQGGVDEGESLSQAAEREIKEECGSSLQIEFGKEVPVGVYKYFFPSCFKRHDAKTKGAKVSFFEANYLSGKVEIDGEEIVEYKWVKKEELKDYFEQGYIGNVLYFIG